jgi:energy-coupling factor transporter ATP-binding protein EcfA2
MLGAMPGPRVERLELRDMRCLEAIDVPLHHPASTLAGSWTCVAGINGAGKSTVLQGLALALLHESVVELGLARLERARRLVDGERRHLIAVAHLEGGRWGRFELGRGTRATTRSDGGPFPMVLGYGATRNLSDFDDRRWSSLSHEVRRVMSLFDPLTQIVSASALLEGIDPGPGWILFASLLERLPLPVELVVHAGKDPRSARRWLEAPVTTREVTFRTRDGLLGATELPDGYRSTLAWLADICLQHGAERPEVTSLEHVEAIVLIDEIDLHLHPELQRSLVPALRAALPRVQWVVTTHSPLLLACFDRDEIIALDRDAPGGVRRLDRQILAFTADDVYRWLMGTSPTGAEATAQLAHLPPLAAEALLRASPEVDDQDATKQAVERRARLAKVLGGTRP